MREENAKNREHVEQKLNEQKHELMSYLDRELKNLRTEYDNKLKCIEDKVNDVCTTASSAYDTASGGAKKLVELEKKVADLLD